MDPDFTVGLEEEEEDDDDDDEEEEEEEDLKGELRFDIPATEFQRRHTNTLNMHGKSNY